MRRENMNRQSKNRGFSLVELVIAMGVLMVLIIGVSYMIRDSANAVQHGFGNADLDGAMRRLSDRITEELKDSGESNGVNHVLSHPNNANTTSTTLNFQRRVAFDGVAADWSTPIIYSLVVSPGENPGNGVDDDDDGVVDEQQVIRTQNGQSVIIADGITGLTFTRNAGEYKIDFVLSASRSLKRGEDPVTRTSNFTVAFRNKP